MDLINFIPCLTQTPMLIWNVELKKKNLSHFEVDIENISSNFTWNIPSKNMSSSILGKFMTFKI